MVDVYKNCPEYENEDYLVRMVCQEDRMDLLKVYSDKRAVPFFNSDNCGGDDFYYTFWAKSDTDGTKMYIGATQLYDPKNNGGDSEGFVRLTIVSKATDEAIGTIELFHRDADDYFTNCGLLRLDIHSDYEMTSEIIKILRLIMEPAYSLFHCDKIATKRFPLRQNVLWR